MSTNSCAGELPIRSVLTLVDFDECSRRALAYAQALSRTLDAHLEVVHVLHPFPTTAETLASSGLAGQHGPIRPPAAGVADERGGIEKRLRRVVDEVLPDADEVGLTVRTERIEDLVSDAGPEAELVVMGHHNRSWWQRLLETSRAERAVRLAECPVLIVPEAAPELRRDAGVRTNSAQDAREPTTDPEATDQRRPTDQRPSGP